MPSDSDSVILLKITTFIGDKNNWKALMAVRGTLTALNPQQEDWSEYSERLAFYFTASGITTDAKKRVVFLVVADQQLLD